MIDLWQSLKSRMPRHLDYASLYESFSWDEEVFNWAREELGISINEFYGQTECNLVLSNCSVLMPPTSGGRTAPDVESPS